MLDQHSQLAPFLTSTPLSDYETLYKKRKGRDKALSIMKTINKVCEDNNEVLSNVIARCCLIEIKLKFELLPRNLRMEFLDKNDFLVSSEFLKRCKIISILTIVKKLWQEKWS